MPRYENEADLLRRTLRGRLEFEPEDALDVGEVELRTPDTLELSRARLHPALFDYQADLVSQGKESLKTGSRALLALPTGAGKTRTALAAVLHLLSEAGGRVAWLAPSRELVEQAFFAAEDMWLHQGSLPDLNLSRASDPFEGESPPSVWFTTPQAVYASRAKSRIRGPWRAVVFDEAHQMSARTFTAAVDSLLAKSAGCGLLGLSATPGRFSALETEELVGLFDRRLLHSDLLSPNPVAVLQRWGVLAFLQFRSIVAAPPVQEADRLPLLHALCLRLANKKRRTLVFSSSVGGAIVLADALRASGVPAVEVHAGLTVGTRNRRIAEFAAGRVQILTNQRLLSTGYGCPAVSDVILGARVGSPVLFEQMVGRAARGPRTGGSARATIWQFDDHLALHGLPQSYYRYRDFEWH